MTVSLDRRAFLSVTAVSGAMVLTMPGAFAAESGGKGATIGTYVRLTADNQLIIRTATTEIGQGTNTAIPMLIVEELDFPFDKVTVENFSPKVKARPGGGLGHDVFAQGAGGSTAIWLSWNGARQAGAVARNLLMQEAAARWNVHIAELSTDAGFVIHPGHGRVAYGALAAGAALRPAPTDPLPLKPRSEHKLIGTEQKQKAARAIVTGERLFGIDQKLPGMVHAVMLRPPVLDAHIARIDEAAALAVPGVLRIVRMPKIAPDSPYHNRALQESVAIVAKSHWAALKGRAALKVEWEAGAEKEDSAAEVERAWQVLAEGKGHQVGQAGDFDKAFAGAEKRVEARYDAPMAAHAPLEPQNGIAHVTGDRALIIAPTQQPVMAVGAVSAATGIPVENIELHPVRCGGGFGRRLYADMIVENVLIARELGVPVKLLWTRECDMATDFYRPGGAHLLRAGVGPGGKLVAFHHGVASQSRNYRTTPDQSPGTLAKGEISALNFPGLMAENRRFDYAPVNSAAPRGAWRAPGHNINGWTLQAFLDEIAEAAGKDPLAYRLELLGAPRDIPYAEHGGPVFSTGRLAGALKLAAEKAGWGSPMPKGSGRGIAGHFSFGTYVAHVVEVTMKEGGGFSVDRVVSGIDCGIVVNPNGVRMQNEGSINDALSAALGQQITISGGRVEQSNFHDYPMMRIDRSVRRIETHIVPSDIAPRGMGEPSFPPFAAALTNAIYAASGKRIRKLPIAGQLG